eukprot:751389-Hanusia_phi.AAC.1
MPRPPPLTVIFLPPKVGRFEGKEVGLGKLYLNALGTVVHLTALCTRTSFQPHPAGSKHVRWLRSCENATTLHRPDPTRTVKSEGLREAK